MATVTVASFGGGKYSRAIKNVSFKSLVLPSIASSSSSSCSYCGVSRTRSSSKVMEKGPHQRQLFHRLYAQSRTFYTSVASRWASKKDFYREDKLPVFDYGKIHPENKRLYVFGQAGHGGLGLPGMFDAEFAGEGIFSRKTLYMHRPVRHSFSGVHDVKDIAAGHGFTLISVKRRKEDASVIFGCGYNTKSQLGYQPSPRNKPLICLISIVPLALPLDKSSKVLALGAGRGHSLISVEGQGLLALGDNSFGQCGRKVIEDEEYMGSKHICRIPPMGASGDDDVIQIASKYDVSICLTKKGSVYTFGCNSQGQLGRGKDVSKPWVPMEVEGDLKGVKVKKVETSGASVVALSDKGQLFGWGLNDIGQINPKTLSNIYYEPIHIKLPRRIGKIIDFAVGEMFTFVLNEYGNVYVWGSGQSLGLGPTTLDVKTPTLMPPPLFGRNEFSPDTTVVKIISSSKYTAAVNSIGDLYMWGLNDNGCLGLGHLHKDGSYQYFPYKVPLGVPVHKVSLGVDHSVVLTKGGY